MKPNLLALALATALPVSAFAAVSDADVAAPEASASADAATNLDAVSVIGVGQARQVQTINQQNLDVLPPGTSLQKILNVLPGVNAQSVDALGGNEQSISLRGFNSTRLGYTLDGVPMGDGAYNNYNGLTINRALISENLGSAELAVGIGNLSIPSTSNLGGTISYYSDDPATEAGGHFNQTVGSDGNRRTFLRLDTGDHQGFSAYVSGMNARSNLWNDQSAYDQSVSKQFNAKAIYQNDRVRLAGFIDTSRTSQADYLYLSKNEMERGLGWDFGGYAPDWDKALSRAYCNPKSFDAAQCDASGPDGDADGAFTGGQILRSDNLYYLSADMFISDNFTLHALGYRHTDEGEGHNWNSGAWSHQGTDQQLPLIFRNTLYTIDREGATVSADWNFGINHLQAGAWFEHNTSSASRYQSAVDGPRDLSGYTTTQPDVGVFDQSTRWSTRTAFIQDSLSLMDERLTVQGGFRMVDAKADATALPGNAKTPIAADSNNQFATGKLQAKDNFLPSAGLNFKLDEHNEVFASWAQNMAMFQGGFKLGPQAVSQATWDSQDTLNPERSTSLEAGYRFHNHSVQFSAAVYDVSFNNRLLQYNPCDSRQPVGPTCGNRFYNVGGVSSRGAELTMVWTPSSDWRWYNSVSYNRSTYDNDYTAGGNVVSTKGKQQVDTPQLLVASELSWQHAGWQAQLRGKYTGKRYYTYTNDQGFGGVTVFDAGASYDFGKVSRLADVRLSLNITNLTDKRYASNLDSSVFAPTDPSGSIYVFHASAPRQVFGSLDVRF